MDSAIVLLFLAILVVGAIFLALITLTRKGPKGLNQQKYRERWLKITNSVTTDQGTQELAVINADKLLDQALRERGIRGETMGERMKAARHLFSNNDMVWSAHKLRNRIAHESNVRINPATTRKAMGAFKSALKDLGAL